MDLAPMFAAQQCGSEHLTPDVGMETVLKGPVP